jgi:hypothetical protein
VACLPGQAKVTWTEYLPSAVGGVRAYRENFRWMDILTAYPYHRRPHVLAAAFVIADTPKSYLDDV